jgi:DNA-binding FrmR family transcriptional regulator
MVEDDRYCPDILSQVTAAQRALQAVSRELVRNHLRHCVTAAVKSGGDDAEQAYDEIVDLFRRSGS